MAHKSSHSSDLHYKPEFNRMVVSFRDVLTLVSPKLKKRHVEDMAKHISNKQNKHKKLWKLVLQEDSDDEQVVPETPLTNATLGNSLPVRDSLVKSTYEETGNLDGNLETSTMDKPINHSEQPTISILEKENIIPPEVLNTESFNVEVRTLIINANLFDTDVNVNKGKRIFHYEAQVNPSFILSSSIETSVIDTTVSLPSFIVPNSSHILAFNHSPTFDTIIH
ncbi:unnamed protein product [Lactuca saligna]|uniref:Uncharacterized protein n=1 Tax=Lactuca saligna TaxID=75948 RepID=A0AA36E6W7_LACSI|nr:unnamed protein product [Lactuca saligna]